MLVPVVSCHKKERNKSEEIPQIEVAEAMTDSVVLHKTYRVIFRPTIAPRLWERSTGRY